MGRSRRTRPTAAQQRERDASRRAADEQAVYARHLPDPRLDGLHADMRATYTQLARHEWSHVRAAIASNPNTPPDLLTELATDPWEWTRVEVARNPAAPETALLTLARSKRSNHHLLLTIARNPNRTPAVMQMLSTRRTGIAHRVACDPLTPVPVLRRYLRSAHPQVVAAALTNPSLPDGATRIVNATDEVIKAVLDQNRGTYWGDLDPITLSPTILDALDLRYATGPIEFTIARALARHPHIHTRTLTRLTEVHPDHAEINMLVARHPHCSPDTLRALAYHDDQRVRIHASNNPNCPDDARVAEALLR
jgi:hypothetical protein